MAQTSTNNKVNLYMKAYFWSDPANQFWRTRNYSESYQTRMNVLVFQFENENKTILNLLDNIK